MHATLEHLRSLNYEDILSESISKSVECEASGIIMTPFTSESRQNCIKTANHYVELIMKSISDRFSDNYRVVSTFNQIIINKSEHIYANLTPICNLFQISHTEIRKEWPIFWCITTVFYSLENILTFINSSVYKEMFFLIRSLLLRLILLPVGTASVERSFLTMNRILNSDRCRLNTDHVDALMKISIEGPSVPDVRDSSDIERAEFPAFISSAYKEYLQKPRRGV